MNRAQRRACGTVPWDYVGDEARFTFVTMASGGGRMQLMKIR
ncbi:hypothetical protein RSSM_03376 [Rhodopirellula sallentina SM41]|uniref:Uncharacterized protein n=1 Tax=Rhodopirellula sallentina SM41 TaxID=1263870 RepID=M5UBE2_9BACT|nr:hypothetical protein RSSM_03376 [Rhodopirellula sallentina SM41]